MKSEKPPVDAARELELERATRLALERVSAAEDESAELDDFLAKLLATFVEVGRFDVATARVREGERLRSRAAIGLEEEVAAGYCVDIDDGIPERSALAPISAGDASAGEHIAKKSVRSLYRAPLRADDKLLAVVYLGSRAEHTLSDDERRFLDLVVARASAALRRYLSREALRQAVFSRDDVMGVVAHDLRNPINVISMAALTLHQRLVDSTSRRPVERIMRAVERADHLIRDLLAVNAIEAGQFAIERGPVETANTILAALESQQTLAASASVILASDISPELPSIEADEERLLEVLENLIGNAVKFTKADGSVTVGAMGRERDVLIWVKDNGQGVPPEHLPHLFDRFWQAKKGDRRGTGLGLTICKAIVEAHGGSIWVESAPAVGTTVFFTLPAPERRAVSKPTPAVANILIVDDRPENILSLQAILERPEYNLLTATSGEEALRIALREKLAVALIDIAMPGMDGLEVAVHLKELERSRDVPIIFITAFGDDPQEIHRAYAAGGADYLVKPLDTEIVRKKVAVFVDLSRRRLESQRLSREPQV